MRGRTRRLNEKNSVTCRCFWNDLKYFLLITMQFLSLVRSFFSGRFKKTLIIVVYIFLPLFLNTRNYHKPLVHRHEPSFLSAFKLFNSPSNNFNLVFPGL